MKAAAKVVLYTVTGSGATVRRTPVGVFASDDTCRRFATAAMVAYKGADREAVEKLGLAHLVTEAGMLAAGLRFTRITLPYEPSPDTVDVDPFAEDGAPAT